MIKKDGRHIEEPHPDNVAIFFPGTFNEAELIAIEVAHYAHDGSALRTRRARGCNWFWPSYGEVFRYVHEFQIARCLFNAKGRKDSAALCESLCALCVNIPTGRDSLKKVHLHTRI